MKNQHDNVTLTPTELFYSNQSADWLNRVINNSSGSQISVKGIQVNFLLKHRRLDNSDETDHYGLAVCPWDDFTFSPTCSIPFTAFIFYFNVITLKCFQSEQDREEIQKCEGCVCDSPSEGMTWVTDNELCAESINCLFIPQYVHSEFRMNIQDLIFFTMNMRDKECRYRRLTYVRQERTGPNVGYLKCLGRLGGVWEQICLVCFAVWKLLEPCGCCLVRFNLQSLRALASEDWTPSDTLIGCLLAVQWPFWLAVC